MNNNTYQRSHKFQETGRSIIGDTSPSQNDHYRVQLPYRSNSQMNQDGGSYSQRQKTDLSLDLQSKLKTNNNNNKNNHYNQQNGMRNPNTARNNLNVSYDNQTNSFFPPIAPTTTYDSTEKYNLKSNRIPTNESRPLKSECDQYQNLMPCQKQQHRKECQVCQSPSPNRNMVNKSKNYKEKILQEEQQIFQQLELIRNKMNNSQASKKIVVPNYQQEKLRYVKDNRIPLPLKLTSLEQQQFPQNQTSSRRDYQTTLLSETPIQNNNDNSSTQRANTNYEWGNKGFNQNQSPNKILHSLNTISGSPIDQSKKQKGRSTTSNTTDGDDNRGIMKKGQTEMAPYSKTLYNGDKQNLNDSLTNLGYNVHSKTVYQNKHYSHNRISQTDNHDLNASIDTLKGTLKKRRPSIQQNSFAQQTSLKDTQRKQPIQAHQNTKPCTNEENQTGIDVQKIKASRQNCINILDNLKKLVSNKQNMNFSQTTQDFYKPQ